MEPVAPQPEGELSTAHNFHDPLSSEVNLRTGRVHLVIAAPVVPGINGQDVDLGIEYSQPLPGADHRILGLPAPWRYRLSYIVGGQLIINGGATYTVDPKSLQGLKYFTVKSLRLETLDAPKVLPFDARQYLSVLTFLTGVKQYFDKAGRLIATADVHGNHVLYFYNGPEDADVRTTTLQRIVDSYGQTFSFTHEENATQITYPSGGGTPRSIRYEFYTTSNVLRMKRYVGPTGRETRFAHTDGQSVKGLLSKIEAPSGLITEFAYGSSLARRPGKVDEKLDTVAKVTRTFQGVSQTTTYTFGAGGHNYTGYPHLFFRPNGVEALLAPRNYRYSYSTTVDDGITRTVHQYNHLHLEVLTLVRTSASPASLISKTQYSYPGVTEFGEDTRPEDLPPYYQQPSEVEIVTPGPVKRQDSGSRRSLHVQFKTFKYNDQGQVTETTEGTSTERQDSQFGAAFFPVFNLEKKESFVYDPHFGLETQHEVHDYLVTGARPSWKTLHHPVVTRTVRTLNAVGSLVETSEVGFVEEKVFKPAQRTTFAHDPQGRLTRQELKDLTRADGLNSVHELAYRYDAAKHRLTLTSQDSLGNSVSREIDTTLGLLVSEVDARGNTTTHTYDALGRRTSRVDPLKIPTRWTHDDTLRTVTEEQANGYKTVVEFNSLGLVTRQSDNAGPNQGTRTLVTRTYDQHGRLTSESGILGDPSKVTQTYDNRGRPTKLTDALGNETTYTYDEGALTRSESFNGILVRRLTFNDRQQVIREVLFSSTPGAGSAHITVTGYNGFGKVVLKRQGTPEHPDALTHHIIRDALGNVVRTEVEAEDETRVIHEEDRDLFGNVTDTTRKLVKGTNTASATSQSFQYDAANRLTKTTLALGQEETYAHDGNGNLTSWKDLAGIAFTQEYDARDALTRTTFTDAGVEHAFVRTHEPQTGRLLSLEHSRPGQPSDKTAYTYTADGLLTSIQYQPDGKTLKWEYSPQTNQLVRFTDAAGTRFVLTYTPQGQLKSKSLDPLPLLPLAPPLLPPPLGFLLERAGSVSFEYYSKAENAANSGKLKTLNHSAELATTYTYDGFGRIQTAVTACTLLILRKTYLSLRYTYDDTTGNIARVVYSSEEKPQDAALNRQVDYQYDGLGQLIQEKESASGTVRSSRTYAYDVAGNVVKRTVSRAGKPDETTLFEYDADHKLVSLKLQNGSTRTLKHDLRGNITDDGAGRKFRYNALGQLTEFVSNPSQACAYDYHPDGLRQGKSRADGAAWRFYYDGEPVPNIVTEAHGKLTSGPNGATFEADAQLTSAVVDSQRVARRDPKLLQTRQVLLEDQGHVIAQLTHSGPILLGENQVGGNHFSAYGEPVDSSGEAQDGFDPKAHPFGFKGEYRDAESGLIYMRARYYDPELLRFLTRDSVPFFNPYNFVSGNPVMLADPTGQFNFSQAYRRKYGFEGYEGSEIAEIQFGGSRKSSVDGWAVAGIVAGLAVGILTAGIGGLIVGGSVSVLAGLAIGAAAGGAAALADRAVNAIHQSVDGNGSFSDNFFNLETLKAVGIGAGVGLLSGGLSIGLGQGARGLATLATRGEGLAFRALGRLIGSQGIRGAATVAARGFEAFSAAAALDLFSKGTVDFNSTFFFTVAAGVAGGRLGPRAQSGAGRIREAWDAKLIRKNLGSNAYASRLLERPRAPAAVVGSVEPSLAFGLGA